ncbi:mechanosensitive ion channel protein MscS [filamentous cyanobacterium CCP5]|nr:mechanosensitive ion channel protein MscS [filamentous cyanobacterium CCP5]
MIFGHGPCRRVLTLVIGLGLAIALHLLPGIPGYAQEASGPVNGESIVLDGTPLLRVAATSDLSPSERASIIQRRLETLLNQAEGPAERQFNVSVQDQENRSLVFVNGTDLITVTEADAALAGAESPAQLSQNLAASLEKALQQSSLQRQEGFLMRTLPIAVGILVAAGLLHWLTGQFWQHYVRPAVQKMTAMGTQNEDMELTGVNLLLRTTLLVVRASLWLGTIYYVTNLFPFTRQLTYVVTAGLVDGLLARSLSLGENSYSVLDLVILLGMLLGLVVVASTFTNLLKSRILRITGINRGSQEAIAVLAKYSLIFIGAVVVLQIWGLDLSSLALIASALGVGIGLGLQNIAKDFVSGLIMVFERPVQVGDFVDFGEFLGTVERIGARSTEIRTIDHVSIIVPNSRFLEEEVINWSHRNPVSRLRLPVGVSYSSHPPTVREALLDACEGYSQILHAPSPQVIFKGFGDSALDFELLVWISQPSKQYIIKSELYFKIEAALKRYHLEVPFPQRDLHIRSGSLPIEVSEDARRWLNQLSETDRQRNNS